MLGARIVVGGGCYSHDGARPISKEGEGSKYLNDSTDPAQQDISRLANCKMHNATSNKNGKCTSIMDGFEMPSFFFCIRCRA